MGLGLYNPLMTEMNWEQHSHTNPDNRSDGATNCRLHIENIAYSGTNENTLSVTA